MEDKSQILYQKLFDKGLYTKTYDDFVTQFSDDEKRTKLHSVLQEKGLYTKAYEDFNTQFFPEKKKNKLYQTYWKVCCKVKSIFQSLATKL